MDGRNPYDRIFNSILITGITISCFYWVCESFMFFFLAPEANFIQHLLGPDRFNTWTRVLVLCLFAIFGSHIQYTINKEREADEALRSSEEKYRSILESVEEGYFETDLLGEIKFLNGPLCRILGYGADELRGMTTQDFTTPETAMAAEGILDRVQRTGEATSVSNYVIRQKDGSQRDLELSISLMPDAMGRPAGFRWVVRDVTDRRRAEEERKKLEVQLQAAQKMEAIGTLAGGIAHDFNNILMGIQGNASLLDIRLENGHAGREKVKNIEKYVESGTQLSRQLLGFARRGKYNVKASDLNDIIEKTASMFARTRKEIRVHRQLAPDVWTVEVDRGQIEQVLLNLYINAWQAMPKGGDLYLITENLMLDENYVQPYRVKPGRFVKVTVADTGVGIDKNDLGRVFEPFFTTKAMGRGTGLGLASAYGIIKSHGGHINVYSEKDQGTAFNFYLPASLRKVTEEAAPLAPAVRRGCETVLLIDDEEMIVDVGCGLLKELGYTVIPARSGLEALDIYRQRHAGIDIVVMDMIMPGMSGGETFDHLKQINPQARVLLSSGYSINGQASQIMERGCNGFIQKPFNLQQLSVKLRQILDDKQLVADS
ncbi:MAG: PAS domain S-box protein [Desulfobacterales bacterium]|jgi:PAS domain S-box-containing protein|nr:PAS domain S-box protein [Desulfobacterales bacterium]